MIARRRGRWPVVLLTVVLHLAGSVHLFSQTAWTPVDREASLSVVFQEINLQGHFWGDGSRHVDDIPSRAHVGLVQVDYGITDKLAFTARLPYIASKFTHTDDPGTIEFLQSFAELQRSTPGAEAFESLDTGKYYATFQDFGLSLRYNALNRGLVVTPVVGVTIPSHDYRTVGEASPGQNRLALQTGVNAGRLLEPFLPSAYVHARYTYSFVQRLYDVSLDRSNAEFEAGYAVNHLLSVRGLAAWSRTHGGLSYDETLTDTFLFLDHDRLLASRYWHLGAGATVALTDSIDLDAAVLKFVAGADTHYGLGAMFGVTWRLVANPSARPAKLTRAMPRRR
ncbi:MAG: hypothetical protein ACRD2N_22420 [Vicinamibacterales bacterium]